MAKLTAAARKAIPSSKFGVPSKAPNSGSYPMPDKRHAVVAKGMAAMHASPADKAQVDAKANRILHGAAKSSHHLGSVPKHGHPVMSVNKMGIG